MKNSFWAVLRENKIGVEMEKKKNIKQSQNKVILNLTADLPHKLFMNKTTLSGRFRIGVRNDFMDKQQTVVVLCPPCGESTARSGVRGYLNKDASFYNPPTALQATSPTRGAGKSGLTLIELLVVVLIIGILASVALPQYQQAVWKSKLARLLPIIKHIEQVRTVHLLAGGTDADSLLDMGFEYPVENYAKAESGMEAMSSSYYAIQHHGSSYALYHQPDAPVYFYRSTQWYCLTMDGEKGKKLCASLTGSEPDSMGWYPVK